MSCEKTPSKSHVFINHQHSEHEVPMYLTASYYLRQKRSIQAIRIDRKCHTKTVISECRAIPKMSIEEAAKTNNKCYINKTITFSVLYKHSHPWKYHTKYCVNNIESKVFNTIWYRHLDWLHVFLLHRWIIKAKRNQSHRKSGESIVASIWLIWHPKYEILNKHVSFIIDHL